MNPLSYVGGVSNSQDDSSFRGAVSLMPFPYGKTAETGLGAYESTCGSGCRITDHSVKAIEEISCTFDHP